VTICADMIRHAGRSPRAIIGCLPGRWLRAVEPRSPALPSGCAFCDDRELLCLGAGPGHSILVERGQSVRADRAAASAHNRHDECIVVADRAYRLTHVVSLGGWLGTHDEVVAGLGTGRQWLNFKPKGRTG
jgi:hypothetical protein